METQETEIEERTFPLTKLNSEIAALLRAAEAVSQNKGTGSHTDSPEEEFALSKVLKKIVIAFGKSENNEHYLFARSSEKNMDDSESGPYQIAS